MIITCPAQVEFLIYSWDPQLRHRLCYRTSLRLGNLFGWSILTLSKPLWVIAFVLNTTIFKTSLGDFCNRCCENLDHQVWSDVPADSTEAPSCRSALSHSEVHEPQGGVQQVVIASLSSWLSRLIAFPALSWSWAGLPIRWLPWASCLASVLRPSSKTRPAASLCLSSSNSAYRLSDVDVDQNVQQCDFVDVGSYHRGHCAGDRKARSWHHRALPSLRLGDEEEDAARGVWDEPWGRRFELWERPWHQRHYKWDSSSLSLLLPTSTSSQVKVLDLDNADQLIRWISSQ